MRTEAIEREKIATNMALKQLQIEAQFKMQVDNNELRHLVELHRAETDADLRREEAAANAANTTPEPSGEAD